MRTTATNSVYSSAIRAASRTTRRVYVVVGTLLLVAGALKVANLADDPAADEPVFANRELAALGVVAEFALGLWLLSGLFPRAARLSAVCTFTVFFVVSLERSWAGETSCGCFGAVSVPPWTTAGIDVLLIALIILRRQPLPLRPCIRRRRAILAGACLLILSVPPIWLMAQDRRLDRLTVTPSSIELGPVPRGGAAEATAVVVNRTSHTVEVVEVRVSCPCVTVSPDHWSIEPGEQILVRVVLDMFSQADFVGRRSVTVTGLSPGGQPVLRLHANADIGR